MKPKPNLWDVYYSFGNQKKLKRNPIPSNTALPKESKKIKIVKGIKALYNKNRKDNNLKIYSSIWGIGI